VIFRSSSRTRDFWNFDNINLWAYAFGDISVWRIGDVRPAAFCIMAKLFRMQKWNVRWWRCCCYFFSLENSALAECLFPRMHYFRIIRGGIFLNYIAPWLCSLFSFFVRIFLDITRRALFFMKNNTDRCFGSNGGKCVLALQYGQNSFKFDWNTN